MRKRPKMDELDRALRADPDYLELCRLLDKQSEARREKLMADMMSSQLCDGSQHKGALEMKPKVDVDARILELSNQGRKIPEITKLLALDGYLNAENRPLSKAAVQKRLYRLRKRQAAQASQYCEPPEATTTDAATTCEPCETCESPTKAEEEPQVCEPCEASQPAIPVAWIAQLRHLIREEIETMIPTFAKQAKDANIQVPPATPHMPGSKRYQGERSTLPGTRIDSVLADLFEAERRNLAIPASELMQRILWAHFDRPALSFQVMEQDKDDE